MSDFTVVMPFLPFSYLQSKALVVCAHRYPNTLHCRISSQLFQYVLVEHNQIFVHPLSVFFSVLQFGLGISMASAVIANIALILRFLERHVRATTLTAIFFLTVHGVFNTDLVLMWSRY